MPESHAHSHCGSFRFMSHCITVCARGRNLQVYSVLQNRSTSSFRMTVIVYSFILDFVCVHGIRCLSDVGCEDA